ncbi:MAG: hypothetical protein E6Q78_16045 [Rhodoferax sp.]|nr:MAG: hypothetical protein E6Q78_16045 [Rhodoferax sp.]
MHTLLSRRPALRTLLVGLLLATTGWASAQTSPLPLKNLLIEVRQDRSAASQSQGIDITQGMPLQSNNRSSEARTLQTSLVLNGRSVRLMSGTTAPLRLSQSYLRNGVIVVLPSTVWLEAGTGFLATPRWAGDGFVELLLDAQQATNSLPNASGAVSQQNSSTQVLVPLNEWTTIAQGDSVQDGHQSGIGQMRNRQEQGSFSLQVRISVPQ